MIKVRKAMASMLVAALLLPAISLAQPQSGSSVSPTSSTTAISRRQTHNPDLRRPRTVRRSAYQEGGRRRHHVSKGQIAMMAAVAGTSMSIGAIAGGGTGLAIGALVGGWGAYAVHRLWGHIH